MRRKRVNQSNNLALAMRIFLIGVLITKSLWLNAQEVSETYHIRLIPAFHYSLTIEVLKDISEGYALKIEKDRWLDIRYRKVCEDGEEYTFTRRTSSVSEVDSIVKKNFILRRKLDNGEESIWQRILYDLDICLEDSNTNSYGYDGFSFYVTHLIGKDTVGEKKWWMPESGTCAFNTLISIFSELEKEESYEIEELINAYRGYLDDDRIYTLISTNPVYLRLLDSPENNCERILRQLVDSLPNSGCVYLDITQYAGRDTECIVEAFQQKYERIYWVFDPGDDFHLGYKKLWGW
jgi:hypothetical protein